MEKQIERMCFCLQLEPFQIEKFTDQDGDIAFRYDLRDANDEHYIDEWNIQCHGLLRVVKLKDIR